MKTIKQLLTTIAVLLCSVVANAYDFEVDGIYYNIYSSIDSTVTLTGLSNKYLDTIVIPQTITVKSKTFKVTTIGGSAFASSSIKSITIPNSIKSIASFAFLGCYSLNDIRIENGNTTLDIGTNGGNGIQEYDGLFSDCPIKNLYLGRNINLFDFISFFYHKAGMFNNINIDYLHSAVTTIGNCVTEIDDETIGYITKKLYIENSEKTLTLNIGFGLDTLYLGRNLNYAELPSYLNSPFGNSKITSVTISENVTIIGDYTFCGCENLTSIIIPNSVVKIGSSAFRDCKNLTNIIIPNSITEIGISAFYGCKNFTSIIIPNSVVKIGSSAFRDCKNLTNITISNRITEISDNIFYECGNLTDIIIPNSAKSIGSRAFYNCTNLTDIIIGDSVKNIELRAFNGCKKLKNIVLGSSMESIEEDAFIYCSNLVNIYLKGINPPICYQNIFTESQFVNMNVYVPKGALSIYRETDIWKKFWNIQELEKYYKIKYLVDSEFFAIDSIPFGEKVTLIKEPTKENYMFSGWKVVELEEIPSIMPAKDLTISGTFTPQQYRATYYVDDKYYYNTKYGYGEDILLIDEPEKEGYTFSGWRIEGFEEMPETMPAQDLKIVGYFTANTYAVNYIVNNEVYATDSIAYGERIILREEPTKEGYTFSGWKVEGFENIPQNMPAKDITVIGIFSNTYAITYIVNDEIFAIDSLLYGSEIILREEPVKEGYTFSGWRIEGFEEIPETMPAQNLKMVGYFTANTYAVNYIVNNEVYATDSIAYGDVIILREELTKEGYTFSGWRIEGFEKIPETMPAQNIIITGTFSINTYAITYIVDNEIFVIDSILYGSEIVIREEPEKEGYIFSGWKIEGFEEVPKTMPAEDITITGNFETTKIENITIDANIRIKDNSIIICGINNSSVLIYTIGGVLVKEIDQYAGEEIILDRGIYIIRIENKSIKIMI